MAFVMGFQKINIILSTRSAVFVLLYDVVSNNECQHTFFLANF